MNHGCKLEELKCNLDLPDSIEHVVC